jgi:hypothetical protein
VYCFSFVLSFRRRSFAFPPLVIFVDHDRKSPRICWNCRAIIVERVRFRVVTETSIKMAVIWVVAPCSPAEVCLRFEDACSLHHRDDACIESCPFKVPTDVPDNKVSTISLTERAVVWLAGAGWLTMRFIWSVLLCSSEWSTAEPQK